MRKEKQLLNRILTEEQMGGSIVSVGSRIEIEIGSSLSEDVFPKGQIAKILKDLGLPFKEDSIYFPICFSDFPELAQAECNYVAMIDSAKVPPPRKFDSPLDFATFVLSKGKRLEESFECIVGVLAMHYVEFEFQKIFPAYNGEDLKSFEAGEKFLERMKQKFPQLSWEINDLDQKVKVNYIG